jgi:DNA-binding HxlR family transcriptional regulator
LNSSNRADTAITPRVANPGREGDDMERRDDAGCRVDDLLQFLAREWMSHIVWALARADAMRFGALRRALPGAVSARVLSRRLKELESNGFVTRHDAGRLPLHVEYRLTAEGRRLDAALRRNEELAGKVKSAGASE